MSFSDVCACMLVVILGVKYLGFTEDAQVFY